MDSGNSVVEQVEKQLNKVIPVIKVRSLGPDAVTADLLLVKVACDPATLGKVNQIAALMKAEVADVSKSMVTLKYAGEHERCETLLVHDAPLLHPGGGPHRRHRPGAGVSPGFYK